MGFFSCFDVAPTGAEEEKDANDNKHQEKNLQDVRC